MIYKKGEGGEGGRERHREGWWVGDSIEIEYPWFGRSNNGFRKVGRKIPRTLFSNNNQKSNNIGSK